MKKTARSMHSWISVLLLALGSGACGVDIESSSEAAADVESTSEALKRGFSPIIEKERFVPVGNGVTLHVIEKYTACSLARRPRRALMMITGTLVTNQQYDADVEGDPSFNALDRAARACFIAVSPTFEGYGLSSMPADGRTVTAERLLPQLGRVVEWVRRRHHVPKVDLLGASLGSSLAVALGGINSPIPRQHINKIVLTANVYKDVTPLFRDIFFSPELRALLEMPPGYIETVPEAYGIILAHAEPAAAVWAFSTFPGVYATGPTLEGFDLPAFPAQDGRAPALQFWGDQDLITPFSDVQTFVAEYGGPVQTSVLPGGGHTAIYEAVREQFWNETFAFLNRKSMPKGKIHPKLLASEHVDDASIPPAARATRQLPSRLGHPVAW